MEYSCRTTSWLPVGLYQNPEINPDELMTQLLSREPLTLHEQSGDWSLVTAIHYPEHQGWLRSRNVVMEPASREQWMLRSTVQETGETPLEQARHFTNSPYLWGGMTIKGIDCSGLVHIAYRRCGQLIPRDSRDQEACGTEIEPHELEPGHLITYGAAERPLEGFPVHVAFWLGNGDILHASGRPEVMRVVIEPEPSHLIPRRRKCFVI
jgi:hypothetical protein